ncbi:hypothetical protein J1N35_000137 [Gossypium stocksii]|uniref:Uncharacterized protein n=1 Tax=Gossypium stocksii TaxID=47602 RepID=A0A9D3WHI0_9ROSI|nr:hypothetical protein J1N35_000137 [Gossypium stocksii]
MKIQMLLPESDHRSFTIIIIKMSRFSILREGKSPPVSDYSFCPWSSSTCATLHLLTQTVQPCFLQLKPGLYFLYKQNSDYFVAEMSLNLDSFEYEGLSREARNQDVML